MGIPQLETNKETQDYYRTSGELSTPVSSEILDYTSLDKKMANAKTTKQKIDLVYRFLHKHVKLPYLDSDYQRKNKFKRSAEQIYESGKGTGCTDFAVAFMAVSRRYGIPTTLLSTAEQGYAQRVTQGERPSLVSGHSFCECYDEKTGKWLLADPMNLWTEENYNPEKTIKLAFLHRVGGKRNFVAYARGRDYSFLTKTPNKSFVDYMNDGILGNISGDYEKDSSTYGRGAKVSKEELDEVKQSLGIKDEKTFGKTSRSSQSSMSQSSDYENEII